MQNSLQEMQNSNKAAGNWNESGSKQLKVDKQIEKGAETTRKTPKGLQNDGKDYREALTN